MNFHTRDYDLPALSDKENRRGGIGQIVGGKLSFFYICIGSQFDRGEW